MNVSLTIALPVIEKLGWAACRARHDHQSLLNTLARTSSQAPLMSQLKLEDSALDTHRMTYNPEDLPNHRNVDSFVRLTLPHAAIARQKPGRPPPRPPARAQTPSRLSTGTMARATTRIPAQPDRLRSRPVHPVVAATTTLASLLLRISGERSHLRETAVDPPGTRSSAHPTPRGPGLAPIILNRPRTSTDNTSLM